MSEYSRQAKNKKWGARKHTCDVDMQRAYAIGFLESIEDTLKMHMYWLNVQGLRVKAFVVCCLLSIVCCLGHSCPSTVDKQTKLTHTCDVDMRTAARYIKISDTTIILQPKGRH